MKSGNGASRGVVTVGYVNEAFPYIYRNRYTQELNGIYVDMWRLFAKKINKSLEFLKSNEYGSWQPDENGNWSGLLGLIQNGSINGTLEGYSYRGDRIYNFRATSECDYFKETFYRSGYSQTSFRISDFLVFSLPCFILLVVVALLVIVEESAVVVLRRHFRLFNSEWTMLESNRFISQTLPGSKIKTVCLYRRVFLRFDDYSLRDHFKLRLRAMWSDFAVTRVTWEFPIARSLPAGCFLLAITFTSIFFSATFKGNATILRAREVGFGTVFYCSSCKGFSSLKDTVRNLESGRLKLVVLDESYLKPEQVQALFDQNHPKNLRVDGDLQSVFNEVCNDDNLLAYLAESQLTTVDPNGPKIKNPCTFNEVGTEDASRFPTSSAVWTSKFGQRYPGTFYLSKRESRHAIEKFNAILLRLYSYDKLYNQLWRRYTNRPRVISTQQAAINFRPITLALLLPMFYVVSILYALSTLILILEITVHWLGIAHRL